MKIAYFSKKYKVLTLFTQKNVSENVSCLSKKDAQQKIKNTGIEQNLILN